MQLVFKHYEHRVYGLLAVGPMVVLLKHFNLLRDVVHPDLAELLVLFLKILNGFEDRDVLLGSDFLALCQVLLLGHQLLVELAADEFDHLNGVLVQLVEISAEVDAVDGSEVG